MKLLLERWQNYLNEGPPKTVYHGTSLYRWNIIKKGGYNTDLLYFADDPDGTTMYWRMAIEEDEMRGIDEEKNAPVILHLDITQLEKNGELQPDWDDIQAAFRQGEINRPPEEISWKESMEFGGTASFRGNLENAIKKVEILS
jgi:hypothetical protein